MAGLCCSACRIWLRLISILKRIRSASRALTRASFFAVLSSSLLVLLILWPPRPPINNSIATKNTMVEMISVLILIFFSMESHLSNAVTIQPERTA
ncbi:hypothetical protein ACFDR9_003297 [Janthinobacterium sp. CG_23.3]